MNNAVVRIVFILQISSNDPCVIFQFSPSNHKFVYFQYFDEFFPPISTFWFADQIKSLFMFNVLTSYSKLFYNFPETFSPISEYKIDVEQNSVE